MKQYINIRNATPGDLSRAIELLQSSQLPTEDLRPDLENFWIAEADGKPVGLIGLDLYAPYGLLRSMIVLPEERSKGIASRLVEQVEARGKELGLSELFLITNTASAYFTRKNFRQIGTSELPASVGTSREMNGLCPASSVIMYKSITL
ncbi:arsenic resistance N-acetyltransferase ArsN2 [Flavihumibacter sp. UBA7668]|uniref:arsenic resistance N-acetyltransferase ArsN2 n=1 Tax=Flavihumibacter sp. UBA7668 TaxID=1946542 RepID=UPI0025C03E3E|nr:arsenic resistance N-acetyltransferase ArsN2 [Flavihumibacter sp. UBA7668]